MKKQWQLIRVLMRCGKVGKAESKSSVMGDNAKLFSMVIGVAIVVLMFLAGGYAAEHQATFGSAQLIFGTVMTMSGILSFFLTFIMAINQLYMASDLDVLVTMPFTPMQIVTAKLVSVATMPAGLCLGMVIPAAIGYAAKTAVPAMFLPAQILGAIFTMFFSVSLGAIVVMIIMRVFSFVRSRNVISIVSTLFVFGLTMVYMLTMNNLNSSKVSFEDTATGIFATLSRATSSIGILMPQVSFVQSAVEGSALNLLIAAGIAAGAVIVMLLVSRVLYFSAALGMTDANGKRGKLDSAAMDRATRRSSQSKALVKREIKSIFSTPSLITNGYLVSWVAPLVVLVPMFMQMINAAKNAGEEGMPITLDLIRQMLQQMNIPWYQMVMFASVIGFLMASLAVALSSISRFIISREGKDYYTLKAMPIHARTLVLCKRRVAVYFNSVSGFVVPALGLIAAAVLGLLPWYVSLLGIVLCFAWLLACVDYCAMRDVQSPNLNWESDAAVTKNNIPGLIIFFVAMAVFIGSIVLFATLVPDTPWLGKVLPAVTIALPLILALVMEIALRKAADRL